MPGSYRKLAMWSGVPLALALSACVGGGAIPSASTPITQSEAQQGAKAHPQLLEQFGGAMRGPQATYVATIGKNVAVVSGLGNARSSFTVTLLNSSVNNAFAIPGGYVYTTRQLVGLMNNEAELAGVLGHEIGHVAARHSQRRQNAAQRNTLLGAAGAILSGILLGNSGLGDTISRGFLQGSQLLTLKFSRKQELEADHLGITYLKRAGYDPRAMSTVLASLAAQNSLDARLQGRDARMPEWASTHPDPASRVKIALADARASTDGPPVGLTKHNEFLTRINGLMYGDDPKQGVIEGNRFIHPQLRLSFSAPSGFYIANGTRAVSVSGQAGKAQFTFAQYGGNLENYVRQQFAALGGKDRQLAPSRVERTTVNSIPAAFGVARVNNGSSQVDLVVFAYQFSTNRAYHFAAIAPAGKASVFNPMFRSMRRVSASEAAKIIPRRISVVTVKRGDTVASLARRMAYANAQTDRFRVLNGMGSSDRLLAGQKVKIVVRGR